MDHPLITYDSREEGGLKNLYKNSFQRKSKGHSHIIERHLEELELQKTQQRVQWGKNMKFSQAWILNAIIYDQVVLHQKVLITMYFFPS